MLQSDKPYNDYGTWLREQFPFRVQKIAINAGFTCPNRDGSIGWGGCTYCNNQTFNPEYCKTEKSVTQQLEEGKSFFARKYPEMKYLAYFQAYTNTYGSIDHLVEIYEEALSVPDVVGLVIGTRPDCVSDELLDYLTELNKRTFLIVEYGIESTDDKILQLINRGHDFACAQKAVRETALRGIIVGAHIILGLPGETPDDMVGQASVISELPITTLKLHQLQLIKGTRLAHEYEQDKSCLHLLDVDEYIDIVIRYIERLRPDVILERFVSQSPKSLLLAPDWGLKNYEFTNRINNRMTELGSFQGRLYGNKK